MERERYQPKAIAERSKDRGNSDEILVRIFDIRYSEIKSVGSSYLCMIFYLNLGF